MKNSKIVKRIASLVLVVGLTATMFACSKKQEEMYDEEGNLITYDQMFEEMTEESVKLDIDGSKDKVGKISVYNPVDFKTVTNPTATYEELLAKREEYDKVMRHVCTLDSLYSNEEKAAAVYNIVRIDNDLSSLMVKVSEQRQISIKQEQLDVQIEKMETLLNDIRTLQDMLEESESVWQNDIDKVDEVEADKILKVKKLNSMALKKEIKLIKKEIKNLKEELEAIQTANS